MLRRVFVSMLYEAVRLSFWLWPSLVWEAPPWQGGERSESIEYKSGQKPKAVILPKQ